MSKKRLKRQLCICPSPPVVAVWLALACGITPLMGQAQDMPKQEARAQMAAPFEFKVTEENNTKNWRNFFTPFQDPLLTRPSELDGTLKLSLPPDMVNAADNNAARVDVDNYSCATLASATDFRNPQKALELLQDGKASGEIPILSLPRAVQLAICHNPQVRATWTNIAQQAAVLGQARSAYLPTAVASANHQNGKLWFPDSRAPDQDIDRSGGNASVRWRLFDFGARGARTDSANYQLQAALQTQNATVQKVLVTVLQNYFDAQVSYARWQAQKNILQLAQRSLLSTQRRQAKGAANSNDVLQAQTAKARVELEISRSKGEYEKWLSNLSFAMGLPPGAPFRLAPLDVDVELDKNTPSGTTAGRRRQNYVNSMMQKDLHDWLRDAEERHPAIVSAKAQWKAAQASVKAAQADGMPSIDAGYYYMRNGAPDQSVNSLKTEQGIVAITLNVPIFDGFGTTYKVRAAQAQAEQKGIEYQATQQQVLQDLVQTHTEAGTTWDNLMAATDMLYTAKDASASLQRQYDKGVADIMQMNQALNNLEQAQMEYSRAQSEWLRAKLKLWAIDAVLK